MAKTNFYDEVLSGILDVIGEVSESIGGEFKSTNPFDKEPIDKRQAQYDWETLPPEVKGQLEQDMGVDTIDNYLKKLGGK